MSTSPVRTSIIMCIKCESTPTSSLSLRLCWSWTARSSATLCTPFFTAGKYFYGVKRYDPAYTVTFNRKDYEYYLQNYPDSDIYFWVDWKQLEYKDIRIPYICGIWRADFSRMSEKIQRNEVALHPYIHRKNDDHNAKDSFLFDLRDRSVFERIR